MKPFLASSASRRSLIAISVGHLHVDPAVVGRERVDRQPSTARPTHAADARAPAYILMTGVRCVHPRVAIQDVRLVLAHPRRGVGRAVEGLPVHTFQTDDGRGRHEVPTEIAISDRREAELAKNGFMPLCIERNTDSRRFIGAQSCRSRSSTPIRTPRERQPVGAAAVPLRACRFAHYLK